MSEDEYTALKMFTAIVCIFCVLGWLDTGGWETIFHLLDWK